MTFHTELGPGNDDDKYGFRFYYKRCQDLDLTIDVDMLNTCDPAASTPLEDGTWKILHVTVEKMGSYEKAVMFKTRNMQCPYDGDVKCFTLEMPETASELAIKLHQASLNCISGKALPKKMHYTHTFWSERANPGTVCSCVWQLPTLIVFGAFSCFPTKNKKSVGKICSKVK